MYKRQQYIQGKEVDGLSRGFKCIDGELPNLLEAIHIAQRAVDKPDWDQGEEMRNEYLDVILVISAVLGRYCFARGYFEYGILLNKAGAKAHSERDNISGIIENYLSIVAFQKRQFDLEGLAITVASLKKLAEGSDNFLLRLSAKEAMGDLELLKKNFKFALNLYEETLYLLSNADNKIRPEVRERRMNHMKGQIAVAYFRMGDAQSAIGYYENILSFVEENLAEENKLVHFIYYAACLCEVGRKQEGFSYVIKTIEGFKNIGQPDYIGSSIRTLGIYIDEYPELAVHPCLDELACVMALKGLRVSILEYIKRLSATHDRAWVVNNLPTFYSSKLIYIMKVISLTSYDRLLPKWGEDMMKELDYTKFEYKSFTLTLNLLYILGDIINNKDSTKYDPIIIQSILKICALLNGKKGLHSPFRLFQWLALWMRQVGVDPNATAEELWQKAKHYLK